MFILGIDLRNDYSQVCYYNMSKGEPESVPFNLAASDLRVPTVVLREYENVSGWMAGEVAVLAVLLGKEFFLTGFLTLQRKVRLSLRRIYPLHRPSL